MEDPLDEVINRRKLPGEGEFDIRGYVRAAQEMGYAEPWGVEVLSEDLRALPLDEMYRRSYESDDGAVRAGRRVARGCPPLDGEEALGLLCARCGGSAHFEERVGQLKRADEVHGLIHLSVGQEAVAAGVCGQLRADDAIYSGHRAHGHAIAKGAPIDRVMAELMGRDDGLCQGLGGSMHLVDAEHGLMGATGVVGGNIPMALGSALAARMGGGEQVAVVFFGDGAVQAGHFNESINLATLWGCR